MNITRAFAYLNRGQLRLMAVAVALAAAGCANGNNEASDLMPGGDESGYRWVGQGERGNFASAYGMCRRTLQMQNSTSLNSSFEQRTSDAVTYNTPNVTATGAASQSSLPNRRMFEGCMRSQGWVLGSVEAQPPSPSAQPTPSGSSPRNP